MIKMNGRIIVVIITLIIFLSSFGAVGTNSKIEIKNECGCCTNSISIDTENSDHGLGEIPCDLPPGKIIDGPATLPASIDWRTKDGYDWTTPIKNQGGCGSCYAFGSYGSMEACLDIRANVPNRNIDLSEQFMVSCGDDWYTGILGCGGAYADATVAFLNDYGAIPESCFGYTANERPCAEKCGNWQDVEIQVVDCALIQAGDSQSIKNALINYGPVCAGFEVYEDFDGYTGGIYEHTTGAYVGNHRVTIVGYNDNPGYWICKNSWGTAWGEVSPAPGGTRGWFRIAYDQCAIEDSVFYIDVGGTELIKYANSYNVAESSGDIQSWGSHGLELSESGNSATVVYDFNINGIGVIAVGIYYQEIGTWGDGPQLCLYNFKSSSPGYEVIKEDTGGTGSSLEWKWYDETNFPSSPDKYVSSSGLVKLRIYAEEDGWFCGDNVLLDSVGIRYIPAPPPPPADPKPDIVENSIDFGKIKPGEIVSATFTVKNVGESGSSLNWKVNSWPSWGTWTFNPSSGTNLGYGATQKVTVTLKAPSDKNQFSGSIVVKDLGDDGDTASISISCSTPRGRFQIDTMLANLLKKFQFLKDILSILLLNINIK